MATTTPKLTPAAETMPKKKAVAKKPAAPKPAAKASQPATAKKAVKNAAKPAAPAKKAAAPKTAAKPEKPRKPKLVRDSFTIPKTEYAVLDELKQRATRLGHAAKKSEVLRAGIKALAALSDVALLAALKDVPAIKTGRPSKG